MHLSPRNSANSSLVAGLLPSFLVLWSRFFFLPPWPNSRWSAFGAGQAECSEGKVKVLIKAGCC